MSLPFGNTGSLGPACAPDRSIDLTVSHTYCPCTLMKFFITSRVSIPVKCSIGDLRYIVGGDRPSQTSHQPLYLYISNYPLSKVPNLVNVSLSRNLGSQLKIYGIRVQKIKKLKCLTLAVAFVWSLLNYHGSQTSEAAGSSKAAGVFSSNHT